MKNVRIFIIALICSIFGCFSVFGAGNKNNNCEVLKSEMLDSKIPEAAEEIANICAHSLIEEYDLKSVNVETPIALYWPEVDRVPYYTFPLSEDGKIVAIATAILIDGDQYTGNLIYTDDIGQEGESFECYLVDFLNKVDYVHNSDYLISTEGEGEEVFNIM